MFIEAETPGQNSGRFIVLSSKPNKGNPKRGRRYCGYGIASKNRVAKEIVVMNNYAKPMAGFIDKMVKSIPAQLLPCSRSQFGFKT